MKYAAVIILTLVLSTLHSSDCKAQYFSDTTYYREPIDPPTVILKVDLLSFLDTYSNLLINVEYRLRRNLYLQHGIGLVTGLNNYGFDFDNDAFINKPIGFKFRNELRFYIGYVNGSMKGHYLAPELLYGYVFGDEEQTIGINCDNGCDFFRSVDFRAQRREAAFHLKIGSQRIYNEKVSLDYFFGIGYKYKWFDVSRLDLNPSDVFDREELYPDPDFGYSLTIGLKIGLLL